MWTVEEMVGVGMNRDAVENFLRCACAKSFKCLYFGLKCGRGHLGGSRVVGRVEQVRAYKGFQLQPGCLREGIVLIRQANLSFCVIVKSRLVHVVSIQLRALRRRRQVVHHSRTLSEQAS